MLPANNLLGTNTLQTIDTLICPRWIVPVEPDPQTVVENHAIAIMGDRILAVLPTEQAKKQYQALATIELNNHAILPGIINTHTHSPMSLFRGKVDDYELTAWNNIIWPLETKYVDNTFIHDGMQLAILEMLRSGTTCFSDHYFCAEQMAVTTSAASMRAVIGPTVFEVPTRHAKNSQEYLVQMRDFCQKWQGHPLIKPCTAPHGPHTVDDKTFIAIKEFAEEYQLLVHIHLLETQHEIDDNLSKYGKRPLQRLFDLGLLNERLLCAHMIYILDEELELLQATKPHILHLPESNLKLASGFCPVEKYRQIGLNVALGTDSAASNNDLDMFGEMRTAALVAKALNLNPTALSAAETLAMATINGARALGWEQEIGSIVPGKAADLVAVDLSAINTQPLFNVISQVVYAMNSRQVTDVWVAGKRLLANKEFTTLDMEKILHTAQQWQKKLC